MSIFGVMFWNFLWKCIQCLIQTSTYMALFKYVMRSSILLHIFRKYTPWLWGVKVEGNLNTDKEVFKILVKLSRFVLGEEGWIILSLEGPFHSIWATKTSTYVHISLCSASRFIENDVCAGTDISVLLFSCDAWDCLASVQGCNYRGFTALEFLNLWKSCLL